MDYAYIQTLIANVFAGEKHLPFDEQAARMVASLIMGLTVATVYRLTVPDRAPSPSFLATLVLYCIVAAVVPQVVGNNSARAFGLAGALTVVRFRSSVEEPRDAGFVILAVVCGMGVGSGHAFTACLAIAVGGSAAWLVHHLPGGRATKWRLTIRLENSPEGDTLQSEQFPKLFHRWSMLSSATAKKGHSLDLRYSVLLKAGVSPLGVLSALRPASSVQSVELDRD